MFDIQKQGDVSYFFNDGVAQSVEPCTAHFGFSYWAYFIPPFAPASTLILGYGAGTIAQLMRKIWGDKLRIAGVDKEPLDITGKDVLYKQDAIEFVKSGGGSYEYVIVDLFNGRDIEQRIFNEDFVKGLSKMTKRLLAVNSWNTGGLAIYLKHFRHLATKEFGGNIMRFFRPMESTEQFFIPPPYRK